MKRTIILIIGIIVSASAHGVTVLHDEAIHGDLSMEAPKQFGILGAGQYLVTGSMYWFGWEGVFSNHQYIGDLDAFGFHVFDGVVDVSITSAIILAAAPETVSGITTLEMLWEVDLNDLVWDSSAVGNPTELEILDVHPVSGAYHFLQTPTWNQNYVGPAFSATDTVSLDYEIRISIQPIPLPAPIVLFCSGLCFLGYMSKRGSNSTAASANDPSSA